MQKQNIFSSVFILLTGTMIFTGCYKRQKDYEYIKTPLDPHVHMSAKNYLLSRSDSVTPGRVDTIFRWMKKAIEYSEIDWAEYEKPNRTYIFLHYNAVRTISSNKITAGFFFDYPVIVKDPVTGVPLNSILTPGTDSMRIATRWEDYPKQFVKNYLLSLIIEGQHTFENLGVANTTVQTLLPPGTVETGDSKLSYVVVQNDPSPDPNQQTTILFAKGLGKGWDQEGKAIMKVQNNSNSPLTFNNRTDARTGGILADNGPIHVFDKTVHPFRYSYQ